MDIVLPSFAIPKNEHEEPSLITFRRERHDPTLEKSKTDKDEPSRAMP